MFISIFQFYFHLISLISYCYVKSFLFIFSIVFYIMIWHIINLKKRNLVALLYLNFAYLNLLKLTLMKNNIMNLFFTKGLIISHKSVWLDGSRLIKQCHRGCCLWHTSIIGIWLCIKHYFELFTIYWFIIFDHASAWSMAYSKLHCDNDIHGAHSWLFASISYAFYGTKLIVVLLLQYK